MWIVIGSAFSQDGCPSSKTSKQQSAKDTKVLHVGICPVQLRNWGGIVVSGGGALPHTAVDLRERSSK